MWPDCRKLIVVVIGLIGLIAQSGCQRYAQSIRSLERENRTLEDTLYAMKYQTESSMRTAMRTQQENDRLRAQLAAKNASTSPYPSPSPVSSRPALEPTPILPMTSARMPSREVIATPSPLLPGPVAAMRMNTVPWNEPPHPVADRSGIIPVSASLPASEIPAIPAARIGNEAIRMDSHNVAEATGRNGTLLPLSPTDDSATVAAITLNPVLTSGWDTGNAGGVRLLIEPLDATGRLIRAVGELTVSLIDPEFSSSDGYCGIWNIDVAQASCQFVQTASGEGIYLELPLSRPPQHRELRLFVRFTDRTGRQIETQQKLVISTPELSLMPSAETPSSTPSSRMPVPSMEFVSPTEAASLALSIGAVASPALPADGGVVPASMTLVRQGGEGGREGDAAIPSTIEPQKETSVVSVPTTLTTSPAASSRRVDWQPNRP